MYTKIFQLASIILVQETETRTEVQTDSAFW